MKSTHKAEVIQINLKPHTNSENLSIVEIEGYTVVVATKDWIAGQFAIHVLPDSICDASRSEFKFLGEGKIRIKPKKLRGVVSYGLLIPAPKDAKVGEDYAERLGIEHYDPEAAIEFSMKCDCVKAPNIHPQALSKYDIDALLKYHSLFIEGELVWVTEKIHGSNARYVYHDGQIYCGSRSQWKKQDDRDLWWQALKNTPSLEEFIKNNPDTVVFGEVYGHVKNYYYGPAKSVRFAAFDVFKDGKFLDAEDGYNLCNSNDIPTVPWVGLVPYNLEKMKEYSVDKCRWGDYNLNEGICVKPIKERWDERLGRVIMKLVNPEFKG